jgi:hypothetical protein
MEGKREISIAIKGGYNGNSCFTEICSRTRQLSSYADLIEINKVYQKLAYRTLPKVFWLWPKPNRYSYPI